MKITRYLSPFLNPKLFRNYRFALITRNVAVDDISNYHINKFVTKESTGTAFSTTRTEVHSFHTFQVGIKLRKLLFLKHLTMQINLVCPYFTGICVIMAQLSQPANHQYFQNCKFFLNFSKSAHTGCMWRPERNFGRLFHKYSEWSWCILLWGFKYLS